jgi:CheY-like chemotaxis protein
MLSAAGPGVRPHVLLSDLGLPGMDGYELLRRVRAIEKTRNEPALPAALITAYARMNDRTRVLEAGFAAHLPKPVEPEQLVATVEQLAHVGG